MFEKNHRPWFGQQRWTNILFSHWPISKEELKHFIPAPFELDTFHGEGWVSLVLFKAMYSRFRWMPQLLSYPPFIQMNLRTYVRLGDQKGIYFLSVDCNHRLATQMAR